MRIDGVISGHVKSCGCKQVNHAIKLGLSKKIHGFTRSKLYNTYYHMRDRCTNHKSNAYYSYGGRGIKVLWKNFLEFKEDMYDSLLDHIEKHGAFNTSIDRIDSNGHYCKENCRWATAKIQGRNTCRAGAYKYKGVYYSGTQLSELTGLSTSQIERRAKKYGHDLSSII